MTTCIATHFDCGEDRYIDRSLVCDGDEDCFWGNDEMEELCKASTNYTGSFSNQFPIHCGLFTMSLRISPGRQRVSRTNSYSDAVNSTSEHGTLSVFGFWIRVLDKKVFLKGGRHH